MKKQIIMAFAAAAMLLCAPRSAHAQIGGLLKKTNKVLGKVNKVLSGTNDNSSDASKVTRDDGTFTQDDGVTVVNPIASHCDIRLVGAYGVSTSENYGKVYLVVKVKMIDNETSLSFGCNSQLPAQAVDDDGNSYTTQETAGLHPKTVTEGMYVKVNLGDTESCVFKDVKRSTTLLQQIRIGVSLSYSVKGALIFRNVPILWDREPE